MALSTEAARARSLRIIEYRIRVCARTGKLAAPAPAKLQCSVASENTGHHLPLLYAINRYPLCYFFSNSRRLARFSFFSIRTHYFSFFFNTDICIVLSVVTCFNCGNIINTIILLLLLLGIFIVFIIIVNTALIYYCSLH